MSAKFSKHLNEWLQSDEPEAREARECLSEFLAHVNNQNHHRMIDELQEAYKEEGDEFIPEEHSDAGYTVALAGLVFYEDDEGYGFFTEHWQTQHGHLKHEYFGGCGRVSQNVTILDTYGDAGRMIEECYRKEQEDYREWDAQNPVTKSVA